MIMAFEKKIRMFKMVEILAMVPAEGKDLIDVDMSKVSY